MSGDYQNEARKLAKAIDIAIDSFTKHPPDNFTKEHIEHVISVHSDWKNSVLNPKHKFRKLTSLKYDIQNVFTYFHEGSGNTVEYFWQQIKDEGLDYIREDRLRKLISRGRIKNEIELHLATDSLVAAEQEGRITKEEADKLGRMIGEFEKRSS